MGLFKEIYCKECGEKTSIFTRKELLFKDYLCSKCVKNIPNMIKEELSCYTYEDFQKLKEYMDYSDNVLNKVFRETHRYKCLHLDSENGLFYLDNEKPRLYLQVGNIEAFQLLFEPDEVKEGITAYKLTGKMRLMMMVKNPRFSYGKIVDDLVKTKAELNILGTKAKYVNPKGVDEFIEALNNSNRGINI